MKEMPKTKHKFLIKVHPTDIVKDKTEALRDKVNDFFKEVTNAESYKLTVVTQNAEESGSDEEEVGRR